MSTWHGDWANRQEPVYNAAGAVVGCVAADGHSWVAASQDGRQVSIWSTRRQAEQEVLRLARAMQVQQVSLEQMAGAALLGALEAFLAGQEQSAKADQAEELRKQNEELRRQNDRLRQALNMVPQRLVRRK